MISAILYIIGGFIEIVVLLRFLFRLIGANAANSIVQSVYDISTPLVAPFAGIFGVDATIMHGVGAASTSVFDWTALVALVVYGLILGFIGSLLHSRRAI